jgi:hypothetical protein
MNNKPSVHIPTRLNVRCQKLSLCLGTCTLLLACFMLSGNVARAQAPVNQLHFAFTDARGGTTTPSDTSLNAGALIVSLTNFNAAGAALDLHGAVGTGVTNNLGTGLSRAMDFTQCRPIGNMLKTLDFITVSRMGVRFVCHTLSHSVKKWRKGLIS